MLCTFGVVWPATALNMSEASQNKTGSINYKAIVLIL